MLATAVNAPSADIEMRISHLFKWTIKTDKLLRLVGLRLPLRLVAWATGHSVQIRINGRWQTVPVDTDEVLANACR
jgi:hypothetical protein